jgi:butyrate kinase
MDKKPLMLIINPGSTSTKKALFTGGTLLASHVSRHERDVLELKVPDQLPARRADVDGFMESSKIIPADLDIVISRGGLGKPTSSGIYEISEEMCSDLMLGRYGLHASALGPRMALDIARSIGKKAIVVDPPSTDEYDEISRVSGLPSIERKSAFHALSQKAAARRFASEVNVKYEDLNLIIAHMGGGITIGAHRKGRVIDSTHGFSEGPFTPERAGALPTLGLLDFLENTGSDIEICKENLTGKGGLSAYLGTNNAEEVERRIKKSDQKAGLIYRAMAYQIAKYICAMAASLSGRIDGIILTGGLAYSEILTGWIIERVHFLGRICIYPGEDEILALAEGGLRAIRGEETLRKY